MEDDFAKGIENLIPYFLHEDILQSKKIHGQTLKGKDLLYYFKVNVKNLFSVRICNFTSSSYAYPGSFEMPKLPN